MIAEDLLPRGAESSAVVKDALVMLTSAVLGRIGAGAFLPLEVMQAASGARPGPLVSALFQRRSRRAA
jgi:hypothetical protein